MIFFNKDVNKKINIDKKNKNYDRLKKNNIKNNNVDNNSNKLKENKSDLYDHDNYKLHSNNKTNYENYETTENSQENLKKELLNNKELYDKLSKNNASQDNFDENNKKNIEYSDIIEEAINQSINVFEPQYITDLISNNLEHSKNLLGKRLIELLTERSFNEIKSNLMIPEFNKELKSKIKSKINDMKLNKLLDNDYSLTQKSFDLAQIKLNAISINSSFSVFNKNKTKGIGLKYDKGIDSKRIDLKKTIRYKIKTNKIKIFYNKNMKHEKTLILFALDISASMRKRFNLAKKFIINFILKNKTLDYSYILFSNYAKVIEPTNDISLLIRNLNIRPNQRTNLYDAVLKATEVIENNKKYSKYFLFIVSDIKPNINEDKILEALNKALHKKLEIFFIAINPDKFSKKYIDEFIKINVNFFELRKTLKRIR